MDGIALGPVLLRWNGLLIMIGVACGGILAIFEAKRRGYDSEIILDLILPLMIWGTVCARIWHVLAPPLSAVQLGLTTHYYLSHPLDLLAIWIGGLGFPGALIGGLIALSLFSRIYELNFGELADILAPAAALAQAIGRLGNYFNEELYGLPTVAAWKIFISPEHRLPGYEAVEYYHPLFAYEAVLSLLNLMLLLWVSRRFEGRLRNGDLFLLYLLNAAMIRFTLEFLRLDVALVNGININQTFMIMLAVSSGVYFYLRNRTIQKL
jgi:phosphatidylglycerol---prolipoprotein diacylglyceryl transferase